MLKVGFIDDKAGKPVGIYEHICIRTILVFGNVDADMQMIEYTKAGKGQRVYVTKKLSSTTVFGIAESYECMNVVGVYV